MQFPGDVSEYSSKEPGKRGEKSFRRKNDAKIKCLYLKIHI